MSFTIQGRGITKGAGTGALLKSSEPISFLSGVNPDTGVVVEKGHPLENQCIAGKVLAFPYGKGSTVGSYIMYALRRNNVAPVAIINDTAETIIATGAIIGDSPLVDSLSGSLDDVADGTSVTVDADKGTVTVE